VEEEHSYVEDLLFGAAQLMVIWKHIANQIPRGGPFSTLHHLVFSIISSEWAQFAFMITCGKIEKKMW
jgi:hypothetical protein